MSQTKGDNHFIKCEIITLLKVRVKEPLACKGTEHVSDLPNDNGYLKSWEDIHHCYALSPTNFVDWYGTRHSITATWKHTI